MKLTPPKKLRSDPENTIPLINVVFLMLIFFLIAGTIAAPVSRELTPAETREMPTVPAKTDVVQIHNDGAIMYLGKRMSVDEVLEMFPATEMSEPVKVIADKTLNAVRLVEILEKFRAAGHQKIRLITVKGSP
ncbi:biopolymer transporter ExbD [Sneathiella sp.]|uniref:ExbD/TolR family protein n=1 Tax=Sneathiella sp. TaxID=1964365 RepID=UPI0026208FC8|nr:biopolymer transporter ExbD [Sneathiella sp.]MDF2368030.1 biopolymer transporter ExbD [Sneathiella sp.]